MACESGVVENLRRCVGVFAFQVSEEDTLAGADPARNRLANGSRAYNDNYLSHGRFLFA